MNDLLHRLRSKDFNVKETCVEAADEIERLTRALAVEQILTNKQSTTIARLQARL